MTSPQMVQPAAAPRLAWFSPMPPSPSGIAAYSAEVVPALRARGLTVDVFTDGPGVGAAGAIALREFVWMQRRHPYDLTVFHMGNASCHDTMWGYVFRYPGLLVLHDAQVHQARARALLQRWTPRTDDYRAEFEANHPEAPPDLALLFAAGLGGSLYAHWPLVRLLVTAARLVAVHSGELAARLAATHGVAVDTIPMGVPDPLSPAPPLDAAAIRARHGVPADAYVIGALGGLTPEKRLPELLRAVAACRDTHPGVHLLLVGAAAAHYDVAADAAGLGLDRVVHVTGFVADAELGAYLQAMDVCACLRWPSNGETSASWWRAMAAGRPTIITDLPHQPELPVVDPRNWRRLGPGGDAVAVAVPILDEHAALVAAIGALHDPAARRAVGDAARVYWQARHTLDAMADAYIAVVERAATRPVPRTWRPAHLDTAGDERLAALLAPFRLPVPPGVAPGRRG
jgi:glycosyltransferase involved in cell wall biosynthesis